MSINHIPMIRTLLTALVLCAASSYALITPVSDDFSTATNTFPNWEDIGSTPTVIAHDSFSAKDWDDGDPATNIATYTVGMEITGDGQLNDGGLVLDTQNAIVGDEAMALDIGGTMSEQETIVFSGSLYNDNPNHMFLKPQLWNTTDDRLLAEPSPAVLVWNYDHDEYAPVEFKLEYTAGLDDIGDQIQIRFLEQHWNFYGLAVGDVFVDNFSVISSTPPPPILYAYEGFDGALGARVDQTGATGKGFTVSDTNFRMVYKDPLTYTDSLGNSLRASGNSAGMNEAVGGTQNMQFTMNLPTNGALFASYLLDLQAGSSFGLMSGLQSIPVGNSQNPFDADTLAAAFRSTSGNFGIFSDPTIGGIDQRTGPSSSPYAITNIFVIMKIDQDGGGMTVWLNPSNLADVSGSAAYTITGSGSGFGSMTAFILSLGSIEQTSIDEIRIGNSIEAVVPVALELSNLYDSWTAQYELSGSNALTTADPDGDQLSNLYEFALRGNPTDPHQNSFPASFEIVEEGGSQWFYYVYPQNSDAAAAGLNYYLETSTNLISGAGWTNTNYEVHGTHPYGFGFKINAVTNRVSTEDEPAQFIRLQINGL